LLRSIIQGDNVKVLGINKPIIRSTHLNAVGLHLGFS
jgi:hypothetical protein